MLPIVSRSSIMKSCRDFLKFGCESDRNENKGDGQKVNGFDDFLMQKGIIQEKLENGFYDIMKESDLTPWEYVKEIGSIDPDLPGKNPEQFLKLLNFFWDRHGNDYVSCVCDFETTLSTLCSAFPKYELFILKEAYGAFIDGLIECSYDFVYVLQRRADFDQIEEIDHFASDFDYYSEPNSEGERIVNLCDTREVRKIFDIMTPWSPIADIVWMLNNYFNVDSDFLDELVFEKVCEFYSVYDIDELTSNYAFNELFKFPAGYDMFGVYLQNLIVSERVFNDLVDECGICIEMKAKLVE